MKKWINLAARDKVPSVAIGLGSHFNFPPEGIVMPRNRLACIGLVVTTVIAAFLSGCSGDGNVLPEQEPDILTQEAKDFFLEHWSPENLVRAYMPGSNGYLDGMGALYFPAIGPIFSLDELSKVPLWVTRDDNEREFFLNPAKWDQFVFGWDDFVRPDDYPGFTPTGGRAVDLIHPWVSQNREIYREMLGLQ